MAGRESDGGGQPDGGTADAGGLRPAEGEAVEVEPLALRIPPLFGAAWPTIEAFARLLVDEGELRGLIGPRELPRLWTRHLCNSAAVAGFVRDGEAIIDVGSGAGFPGLVLAAMRPGSEVHLVETMERRAAWLTYAAEAVELDNVVVHRARAEELHTVLDAPVVTARAVAALPKLARWCLPLVADGGRLLALKGRRAADEVAEARPVLAKLRGREVTVHEDVRFDPEGEGTTIVEVRVRR